MILETCPSCHRPFEAKPIAREEVDASDLTKEQVTPILTPTRRGILGPTGPRNPEAVLTYNVRYKCKHCGKEWSKIETKEWEFLKSILRQDSTEQDTRKYSYVRRPHCTRGPGVTEHGKQFDEISVVSNEWSGTTKKEKVFQALRAPEFQKGLSVKES